MATTNLEHIQAERAARTAEEMERQRSLVLIGIPEQTDPLPQTRAKQDEQVVERVLNELGVESRPIATYRLGRPSTNLANPGGPRLIKIVLPATVFQRIALSNWKKKRINIRQIQGLNRLIVRPSLTPEQRQREKNERNQRMANSVGTHQSGKTTEN